MESTQNRIEALEAKAEAMEQQNKDSDRVCAACVKILLASRAIDDDLRAGLTEAQNTFQTE